VTAPAPPIRWDLVEEHLDEAAFLAGQWERALVDPEYTLAEVLEGPEARLLAHLDGLVVAGRRAAEKLLLPALGGDDPGLVFAAASSLLASEDGDFTEPVLKALAEGEPAAAEAVRRALQVAPRSDLFGRLAPLLARGPAAVQARVLEVLAFRRLDPRVRLDPLAGSKDAALRLAILRVGRVFPEQVRLQQVELALGSEEPAERALALEVGLVQGSKAAWAAVERALAAPVAPPEWAQAALAWALSGERELRPLLGALADPGRRQAALYALGFTGRVAAVEAVLPWLADEQAGKVAAEAFGAVTGLAIEQAFAAPGERWDPDAPEDEEEAQEEKDEGPEADLPAPEPEAVLAWWRAEKARFDPAQRWLGGRPWTMDGLVTALAEGSMRRRPALALDLAVRSRGQHQLEATAPARRQVAELAEIRRALPRGVGTYREIMQVPAPRGAVRAAPSAPPARAGLEGASGVVVTAIGMVTALGDGAAESHAASRAGLLRLAELDGLQAWNSEAEALEPVRGHAIPHVTGGFSGVARLARLGAAALRDLLRNAPLPPTDRLGLFVLTPSSAIIAELERQRIAAGEASAPGPDDDPARSEVRRLQVAERLLPALVQFSGLSPAPTVARVFASDATGFGAALQAATEALTSGVLDACLVGGVDSLVEKPVVEALSELRILCTADRAAGLVPGEAGAFLLLERATVAKRRQARPLAVLSGWNARAGRSSFEEVKEPGKALAEAVSASLRTTPTAPGLLVGHLNGDERRALEWGHAMARLRLGRVLPEAPEWQPAVSYGEVGAAAGPLAVCSLVRAAARGALAQGSALVWLWSDLGERAAFIVRTGS